MIIGAVKNGKDNYAIEYVESEFRAYRVMFGHPYEVTGPIAKKMEQHGVNVAKLLEEGAIKVVQSH